MSLSEDHQAHLRELARLTAAITAAGDIIYEWDLADDVIVWRGDCSSIFAGRRRGAPGSGEELGECIHPEDQPQRLKALSEHLSIGAAYDCEFRIRGADGEFHWVHDRGAVDAVEESGRLRLLGCMRLITRRKLNEARLEYLAHFDDLTGHYNKLRLRESLDQAISEGLRFDCSGAFVVFGLDQLAMINSAYGYEVGDRVLVEVGHRLDECLRGSDVIGRLAGDRFGVILARIDQREAMRTADRAVHEIRRETVQTAAGPLRITASAGVCLFPDQGTTSLDIMAKAETALRQAKVGGRNRTGIYEMSEEQRRSYRASMDIGAEVQQAMKDGRLVFAYQPIIDAGTSRPSFYECLLRLQRADGEILPAGRFIPVVEKLGLSRALDRRVLDMAIDELKSAPEVTLAINISSLTATEQSWLRALTSKVKDREDIARRLVIEITETAALQDIEESARFVRSVRELGCRVALDDFGAGYTTFRHLRALTADIVKIDGSFVRNIAREPHNQLFVRNLVSLANSLDLKAVAECIETQEEAEILVSEGADMLQGYHYGRPTMAAPWYPAHRQQVVDLAHWNGARQGGGSG